MRYLLQGEPAAPSQIAAATGLQRTNLSTTLRGLEQKGLVQRHANPSDGRGVTVSPTERGRINYALVGTSGRPPSARPPATTPPTSTQP